ERMSDPAVRDLEANAGLIREDARREARGDGRGIVNAAPQMPAIGHVTGLAADPCGRLGARLPFRIGVFEGFAVDRLLGWELVAAAAEFRGFEETGPEYPPVGRGKLAGSDSAGAALRRPEPAVLPDVASAAAVAGCSEPLLLGLVGNSQRPCRFERRALLGQRRMTAHALRRIRRVEGQ